MTVFTAICVATKVFFQASRLEQIDQTATLYLLDFFRLASQLVTAFEPWQKLAFTDLEANQTKQLTWLSIAEQETAHLRLHFSYLDGADFLQSKVYPKFEHVLFFRCRFIYKSKLMLIR